MVKTGIIVQGIPKAVAFTGAKLKLAIVKADTGIKDAGFFIQEEVKQSIAGHRAEHVSVDTGRFLNSIQTNFKKLQAIIFPTVDYADFLEFGTSKLQPRHHFSNTKKRNAGKIKAFIQAEVNKI